MKRMIAIMLLGCFLLSGCSIFGNRLREPVTFYYLQAEYQHGTQEPVFSSEERESSGHRQDLHYLIALYLMGPASEELVSPLPKGTRILSASVVQDAANLELSNTSKNMTDIQFTLACSCLALTCFELSPVNTVTIASGERSLTILRDSLILIDTQPTEEPQ